MRVIDHFKLYSAAFLNYDKLEQEFNAYQTDETIVKTCKSIGLDIKVKNISVGPVYEIIDVKTEWETTIDRIRKILPDLTLALDGREIVIDEFSSDKRAIRFLIPKRDPEQVKLDELVKGLGDIPPKETLPLLIGKDLAGEHVIENLKKLKNILIYGTWDSGKTSLLNTFICSLVMCRPESMMRLLLIDSSGGDLSHFSDLPHLDGPIVSKATEALQYLNWIRDQVEIRESVNTGRKSNEKAKRWGDIIVIIDSLSELVSSEQGPSINSTVQQIALRGYRVGIHIIATAMYIGKNLFTEKLDSSFKTKISLKQQNCHQSGVLGFFGAEKLMHLRDMILSNNGEMKWIHYAYQDERKMYALISALESTPCNYNNQLMTQVDSHSKLFGVSPILIEEARGLIKYRGIATIDMLMRTLGIQNLTASAIIDYLLVEQFIVQTESKAFFVLKKIK